MRIALVGKEKSGKTTIFNALTGHDAPTGVFGPRGSEPTVAVVRVHDPRVERLAEIYRPRKITHATLELMDFPGIAEKKAEDKEIFSSSALTLLKSADAIAIVLRNFSNNAVDALLGPPDAASDLASVRTELALEDFMLVQTRLERIEEQTSRNAKNPSLLAEREALQKIASFLDDPGGKEVPSLDPEEERSIRGLRLLCLKPVLVVLNADETTFGTGGALLEGLKKAGRAVEIAGKFEMELTRLDKEEALAFMEEMGIEASARNRLTLMAYDLMGCISFFTVGDDEVRAWTIRKGWTAREASGVIHSDLARGFIRAECFSYEDLVAHGSEKALRERGLVRLEGKDYVVKDGDILSIRFKA